MVMPMHKFMIFSLTVLLLAACGPIAPDDAVQGPQVWIDAPLPGTVLEVAPGPPDVEIPPVQLVSHFSDPDGVTELEFSVNGEVVGNYTVSGADEELVTDSRTWAPPAPGEYALALRVKNAAGIWSNYAETYVLIPFGEGIVQGVVYAGLSQSPLQGVDVTLQGCGPQQTQTTAADGAFNFNGLPAGSCTVTVFKQDWSFISSIPDLGVYPIPVASDPNLPTAFSITMDLTNPFAEQTGFSDKSLSTSEVFDGECGPNTARFETSLSYSGDISSVLLFFNLQNPNGNSTGWNSGVTMNEVAQGAYALTLTGEQLAQGATYEQGTVLYQFVVEPTSGQAEDFLRSAVYSDLAWFACDAPETEPTNAPECSDGIDNDGDGRIDYAPPSIVGTSGDRECTGAEDDSESS